MNRIFITAAIAALLHLLSACEHKELCDNHEHVTYSRVRVDVDWTDFLTKETPSGMTVAMYPDDPSLKPVTVLTNNISHAVLNLPVGGYSLLVYNQSPSEFGSLRWGVRWGDSGAWTTENKYTSFLWYNNYYMIFNYIYNFYDTATGQIVHPGEYLIDVNKMVQYGFHGAPIRAIHR